MLNRLFLLLMVPQVLATTCGARAETPAGSEAREVNTAALDDRLYVDMEKVGRRLKKVAEKNGHFPAYGPEMQHALARLIQTAPVNPYKGVEAEGKPLDRARVTVLVDKALSPKNVKHLEEKSAPYWSAEPGMITVITNGSDLILIWGAGADSKPIKDLKTGKLRVVVTDYAPAETKPAQK